MKIIRRAGERRSPKLTAETDGRYHRSSLGCSRPSQLRKAGSMQAGGVRGVFRWRYWRGGSEEERGPELGGMEAQERWTVRLEKAKGDEFCGKPRTKVGSQGEWNYT